MRNGVSISGGSSATDAWTRVQKPLVSCSSGTPPIEADEVAPWEMLLTPVFFGTLTPPPFLFPTRFAPSSQALKQSPHAKKTLVAN